MSLLLIQVPYGDPNLVNFFPFSISLVKMSFQFFKTPIVLMPLIDP